MARKMRYFLIFLIGLLSEQVKSSVPVVQTHCGQVAGKTFQVVADDGTNKTIHEFANIPYAVPPKGNLRWRAPVDLKDGGQCWHGTLKYDDRRIMCPQSMFFNFGDEDCLVLSVSTPNLKPENPLPVAVWIHGGGFTVGYSRIKGYYPDVEFTASMNVISVTINYRLGYFGFLSLEELWDAKPTGGFGNYGIMDQILALKWVQKNIRNFGGDPNRVTVYGESAGGTAGYALLTSITGVTRGLFQKVIPMSGLSNFRTTTTKANKIFRPVINKVGCSRSTKEEVAKCLRSLSRNTVLNLGFKTFMPMTSGWAFDFPFNKPYPKFVPIEVIDPLVIKDSLEEFVSRLRSSPEEHKLDILVSNMAQETLMSTGYGRVKLDSWKDLQDHLEPKFDSFKKGSYLGVLSAYRTKSSQKTSPTIIDPFYVYTTMISDVRVGCTTARKAKLFSTYEPFRVTSYVMSQPLDMTLIGKPMADHGFDTTALFGFKFDMFGKYRPTKNDKNVMKNIRSIFRRFFHSDPTFNEMYRNKNIEFWNNTILAYSHSYHEKECKLLRDLGLSKHAWGNLGLYND